MKNYGDVYGRFFWALIIVDDFIGLSFRLGWDKLDSGNETFALSIGFMDRVFSIGIILK